MRAQLKQILLEAYCVYCCSQAFAFLPVVWVAPFHWGVLTYLAYVEVGWSAFTIIGFVFVLTPLQLLLAKMFSKFRYTCVHIVLSSAILTMKH